MVDINVPGLDTMGMYCKILQKKIDMFFDQLEFLEYLAKRQLDLISQMISDLIAAANAPAQQIKDILDTATSELKNLLPKGNPGGLDAALKGCPTLEGIINSIWGMINEWLDALIDDDWTSFMDALMIPEIGIDALLRKLKDFIDNLGLDELIDKINRLLECLMRQCTETDISRCLDIDGIIARFDSAVATLDQKIETLFLDPTSGKFDIDSYLESFDISDELTQTLANIREVFDMSEFQMQDQKNSIVENVAAYDAQDRDVAQQAYENGTLGDLLPNPFPENEQDPVARSMTRFINTTEAQTVLDQSDPFFVAIAEWGGSDELMNEWNASVQSTLAESRPDLFNHLTERYGDALSVSGKIIELRITEEHESDTVCYIKVYCKYKLTIGTLSHTGEYTMTIPHAAIPGAQCFEWSTIVSDSTGIYDSTNVYDSTSTNDMLSGWNSLGMYRTEIENNTKEHFYSYCRLLADGRVMKDAWDKFTIEDIEAQLFGGS